MNKDRYSPRESKLGSIPIGGGMELLLDRETCRHLGLSMPVKGFKFRITRIPLKKRKLWLKQL